MNQLIQFQLMKVGINNLWNEAERKEVRFLILCFGVLFLCIADTTIIDRLQ